MPIHQMKDDFNNPIPVVRRKGTSYVLNITAAGHVEQALSSGVKLLSFWGDGQFHIAFGNNSTVADASSDAIPANYVDYEPLVDAQGNIVRTHVSVYAPENTTVYISERE